MKSNKLILYVIAGLALVLLPMGLQVFGNAWVRIADTALLYVLLSKARKDGMMTLESDVDDPQNSPVFAPYPVILADARVLEFLTDYLRLMVSEVLPNCTAPLIVQASLGISTAILDAAALGFLGLGAQPPAPEWGTMLADAREFVLRAWWVVTLPGVMIFVTVLAFNLLGDGLRDAFDPKLKR